MSKSNAIDTVLANEDPFTGRTQELKQIIRIPTLVGLLVVFGFVGSFILWGMLMPLAAGAIAPGIISPEGNKRTVQHLEGGIIAKLPVQDGDRVEAQQELIVLESVQARSKYEQLNKQYITLTAMKLRLEAEKENAPILIFPDELLTLDEAAASIMDAQSKLFNARQASREAKQDVLYQRIQQFQEQINGLKSQRISISEQLAIINDELDGKQQLADKGLVRKPDLLRLKRQKSDLSGQSGQYSAQISQAEVRIGETHMQRIAMEAERDDEIAKELAKVSTELSDLQEQLRASEDILNRTILRAPVSGVITNIRFATIGGVIRPGEAILDIVPSEERLLIDARVSPTDIDVVHHGLMAQINLPAFSSSMPPRLSGKVISVAADSIVDEKTGQSYYPARIEVDAQELLTLEDEITLIPGMAADVLIVTEHRTLLEYLFEPLIKVLRKSFREV